MAISCITGDNLFLNGVLGFVESFTANFPCSHCTINCSVFSETFNESDDSMRTVEVYERNVAAYSVSQTGVKALSALNKLSTFHAALNYVQDIMHDVFEGVCMTCVCYVDSL